jgi:hypothetical protein
MNYLEDAYVYATFKSPHYNVMTMHVRNLQHKSVKLQRIRPRFQSLFLHDKRQPTATNNPVLMPEAGVLLEESVSQLSNDFHNRIIQWLNVAIQLTIRIHKTTIYPVALVMNTNKDTIYPLFSRSAIRDVSFQGTNTAVGCFRTQCLAK